MYAVVDINGKQYKVEKDMMLNVDRTTNSEGDEINIDKVLLFADGDKVSIGQPYLSGVKITAKVMGNLKGKKVLGVKFLKRKNHTKTIGNRPQYTCLKIGELSAK
jgi:large subunit ribosomal protein L21